MPASMHSLVEAFFSKQGQGVKTIVCSGVNRGFFFFLGWEKLLMSACGWEWFSREGKTDDSRGTADDGRLEVSRRKAKTLDSRDLGRFISEARGGLLDIWNFLSVDAWVSRAQLLKLSIYFLMWLESLSPQYVPKSIQLTRIWCASVTN